MEVNYQISRENQSGIWLNELTIKFAVLHATVPIINLQQYLIFDPRNVRLKPQNANSDWCKLEVDAFCMIRVLVYRPTKIYALQ